MGTQAAEQALGHYAFDGAGDQERLDAELEGATALRDNGFKIELARRTIVAVLRDLSGGGPP